MSRPNKPWFRKSNKRWYVWFDGRQVNLGPDKAEAHRQFHALMAQPKEHRIAPNTTNISLVEVVDFFLDWVVRNRAADTYTWYQYRLERLCQTYPEMTAASLRPYHVEEWVAKYQGLSQNTRRNYLRAAKRCYKWAKKQGYLRENPIVDIELPAATAKEVCLTQSEFEQLLSYVRNESFRDLLITTWETGCRPQELLRVEARHVDLAHQRWVFYRSESKNKRISRVVYLTDLAAKITQRMMQRHPHGTLFRNSHGRQWTTDAVNCAFQAVQVRMGKDAMVAQGIAIHDKEIDAFIRQLNPVKNVRGRELSKTVAELRCEAKRKLTNKTAATLASRYCLYALRHSFATNALRKGLDSLTVATLLGHEDPSTLAKVYQHLNQNPQHLLNEARRAAG